MLFRKIKKLFAILKGDTEHLYKGSVKIEKRWYGNEYGGFYAAPQFLNEKSIVYSFGIGEDVSFDCSLITNHGCQVFGFDPTPKSIQWIKDHILDFPSNFHFYEYGIADKSCKVDFFLPNKSSHVSGSFVEQVNVNIDQKIQVDMRSLRDITVDLGHKVIDILKMDIEGAEYVVLNNILSDKIRINQILIEFHDRFFSDGKERTKTAIAELKKKGYHVFGVSDSLEEISFIHISLLNKF